MKTKPSNNGFTLIEVIVAVAVIAFGLAATIKTVSTVTRNTSHLNEQIVATWAAQNAMALYELNIEHDAAKETSGVEELAGVEWYWKKVLVDTQDPDIKRVEIEVRRDEEKDSQVYATLVSLLPAYFEKGNRR